MKEQVKVLINSKKEAKQVKAILKGLGEYVNEDYWDFYPSGSILIFDKKDKDALLVTSCHSASSRKEISIRDLIILLTKPEEEKVFVMTSEDGVKLYYGDEYYGERFLGGLQKWELADFNGEPFELNDLHLDDESYDFPYLTSPINNKAFSTKEAAEKWILEQNKVSEVKVSLFDKGYSATVSKSKIIITDGLFTTTIKPSDIWEIVRALGSINNTS